MANFYNGNNYQNNRNGGNNNFKKDNRYYDNRNAVQELPNGYLEKGYYEDDEKKIMRVEYIVQYPKEIVDQLKKDRNKNKSSQLRRYYEFVIRIKDRLRQSGTTFDEMKSEIGRLIPFAEYAVTRGKVSAYFQKFINKNINSIRDERDFMAFAKHFEAIIANLPKEN